MWQKDDHTFHLSPISLTKCEARFVSSIASPIKSKKFDKLITAAEFYESCFIDEKMALGLDKNVLNNHCGFLFSPPF